MKNVPVRVILIAIGLSLVLMEHLNPEAVVCMAAKYAFKKGKHLLIHLNFSCVTPHLFINSLIKDTELQFTTLSKHLLQLII